MNILITGASGLIGTALQHTLPKEGHTVYCLRRDNKTLNDFYWQPTQGIVHFNPSIAIDAVINLAGANISNGRWTQKKKQLIVDSRVKSTQCLSEYISKLQTPPKIYISGSAIGYYGETGNKTVTEFSHTGTDFLSNVARQWEAATQPAVDAGIRTINLRTGIVLSTNGGALQKMLFPFKLGLGGVVGSGNQYMSWVSLNDVTRVIGFILKTESIKGPLNMVSPEAATNFEFTKLLGKALNRPTIFPIPAFIARLLFGEMADALLLTSIRVKPEKLIKLGFSFTDTDLYKTLKSLLK